MSRFEARLDDELNRDIDDVEEDYRRGDIDLAQRNKLIGELERDARAELRDHEAGVDFYGQPW